MFIEDNCTYPTEEIRQKINDFIELWPMARYGPGHIVLDDFNLEDHFIEFCLNACEEAKKREGIYSDSEEGIEAVAFATEEFLKELLKIPEHERTQSKSEYVY